MVNLCDLNLWISTSVGLNVNAGKNNVASFIASSTSFGNCGSSDGPPSTILNCPSLVKNKEALFGRKNSKSCNDALPGCGIFTTTEPVPSNCLESKSKEFPVIWSIVVTVSEVPAIVSQVGLKSKQSIKSKEPVGSGASGSTLVAVYVGMSS